MSVAITYFVHGTTTDNEAGKSSGWFDAPLSPVGLRQSQELQKEVLGKKFDAVFSSDLSRALDSANIVFKNITVVSDQRLRECNYGIYNGQPETIVEPLQQAYIEKRFPGGESYSDVKDRVEDFLKFLKEQYQGKHVAIVSHKAPQLALDVLLSGKTWEEAFAGDWRKTKAWQPGWKYEL